jgi:hypothetical protein
MGGFPKRRCFSAEVLAYPPETAAMNQARTVRSDGGLMGFSRVAFMSIKSILGIVIMIAVH